METPRRTIGEWGLKKEKGAVMFGRVPGQERNHFHLLILDPAVRPNTTKQEEAE